MHAQRRGALLQEALVAAHHELGLELLHRFERYADHDQDRGTTEVEILVCACNQDRRYRSDGRQEEGTRECQSREDPVEEFRGRAPWTHTRYEATVLLQIVSLIDRVEGDGRVEVGKDHDEDRLAQDVVP